MNEQPKKPQLKILFSVDDVHPEIGFGLYKERDNLKYLFQLHQEFGIKFNLFIVPRWGNQEDMDIEKNKEWIQWLSQHSFFEISAHGVTHKADDEKYKHLEFLPLNREQIKTKLKQCLDKFHICGIDVRGWKTSGWLHPNEIYEELYNIGFDWIADHIFGENIITLSNGLIQVPYNCSTEELEFAYPKNVAIIHSHINPANNNQNGWTEQRYLQTKQFLFELQKQYEFVPMTFSEYVREETKSK